MTKSFILGSGIIWKIVTDFFLCPAELLIGCCHSIL